MIYPKNFLSTLDQQQFKTIYTKIVAYNIHEEPIEWIHGYFTGGSINIDGTSSVRRTCSLNLVTEDNFSEYVWVPKTRFKLYIGVKNTIQNQYLNTEDIIWFNQGEYVITSFNFSVSNQGRNISMSGKDKMALVNGEISGSFEAQTDLGTEEIVDQNEEGETTITLQKVPIKNIIRKMMQHYAGEVAQNIIINDLEDYGLELLDYRGDTTLYAFKQINADVYTNITFDSGMKVKWKGIEYSLKELDNTNFKFNTKGDGFIDGSVGDTVVLGSLSYNILKIKYGQTAGYKLTELVYPGDLIANIGDNVGTILDKIVAIFSEFEYFYNINGQFIFQKKKIYTTTSFSPIVNQNKTTQIQTSLIDFSPTIYNFYDNKLINSISNNSNIAQIKNDFSIWGERIQGDIKIPFHLRYAISEKPKCYYSLTLTEGDEKLYKKITNRENVSNYQKKGMFYYTREYNGNIPANSIRADWRELIYQMANDYFKANYFDNFSYRLHKANADYEGVITNGKTGYEHFYTDIQGFWRQLYVPASEKTDEFNIKDFNDFYWNQAIQDPDTLVFWFDFLPSPGGIASQMSVQQIGDRLKTTSNKIDSIYHDTPTLIYITNGEIQEKKTGYDYINLSEVSAQLFNISAQQNSAFDILNQQIQQDFFEHSSISIQAIPIYYLEPNNLIYIQDKEAGIEGQYIINSISYPLGGGTMSINANSVPAYVK